MIGNEDWQREQQRLDEVSDKLRARIAEIEPEVEGLQEQAVDIRRKFWEEVSVNTATGEDFEETVYSIEQQEALLSERERSYRNKVRQHKKLQKLLESPYFGRIDFREDGTGFTEDVYIGVSSFAASDGLEFLVYDWRTPIASLYYDHSPGRAEYETPGGPIAGVMELKRQYRIQGGKLQSVFDTGETIGDRLLQDVLGGAADNRMKSIVATIQKEQNAIIRDESSAMLIVQGAAGGGKTSAALQRVAYLLYSQRDRLKADQIVLFSPNPMFNGYVSTVLPELGEENMRQTTFQEYLDSRLGRTFKLEDPFDQMEYVLSGAEDSEYEARLSGIRYKASTAFLDELHRYAQSLEQSGMRFKPLVFRGRELMTAEKMKAEFYGYDDSMRLTTRVVKLQERLLEELKTLERREYEADWVQEELNYIDSDLYEEAYRDQHREQNVFDFVEQYAAARARIEGKRRPDEGDFDFSERVERQLRRSLVGEAFKPLKRGVNAMAFIDMPAIYRQLFEPEDDSSANRCSPAALDPDLGVHWSAICRQTREKLACGELLNEDATPYLYLKELIEGMRGSAEIRHVFIDEGQDYSAFQYAFFKKMFPRARMTVLGDFSQAIFAQSTELSGSGSPLISLYGAGDTRLFRLTRSYRSTREIVEFTRALLPETMGIEPFDRSGGRPLLVRADTPEDRTKALAAHLARLREEGFDSIGIVTKTAAEAREAYEALTAAGCAGLKEVTKTTPEFEQGTLILPVYLAKGVEFDAVLIYDASARSYSKAGERKLFYTACTRAMHRLALFAAEEWSPFIESVDESLYETKTSVYPL
ncbi:RNA polymerase recycling motor HelD [Saccharibacillus sp. CPCC 101409]|uniref:RNA polymerase recycling motor HelD n=1 Tax=Saccharibacillus sp. CPCC 101409 TaxID=3058041 RepID=UPI00267156E9|nr:RNA polymerase recycling motor HelD [Saccharibacillus sp. CPCC 101409]MDO3409767.1 RNA polymerase recycling motor HelD [Saccharibacillus sp. CPCC 101409]